MNLTDQKLLAQTRRAFLGKASGLGIGSLALAGMVNAIFAQKFDDIAIIPTFVLTPLTYLGGVFYSMDLLPDFWAGVSKINPMVYVVNAFRYGVLGVSDVDVRWSFTMILFFTIIAYTYSMHLLNTGKRLRQ